ncbi:MAG: hypothetical protein FJX66_13880 [Alphaproteobacteria bacterium]|nr:hypothetical protein [Alphaproteobacteria bacterium]
MVEQSEARSHGRGGLGQALRSILGGIAGTTPYRPAVAKAEPPPAYAPADLVPGDAGRGSAILARDFTFNGLALQSNDGAPWLREDAGEAWLAALHGFGWLRDLHAVAGAHARVRARELILDWMARGAVMPAVAQSPGVLGARLSSWLVHREFLEREADGDFLRRFQQGLGAHAKQLTKAWRRTESGAERIAALKGLIYSGLAMADGARRLQFGLKQLETELATQVLADGAHIERSPSAQLAVLRDLVDLRASLIGANRELPAELQPTIDRLAPMLRGFRHGDGGLALFNDSVEEEPWLIDRVLAQSDAKGRPIADARHGGFQRVQAGRTLVIMDSGLPPTTGRHGHAGTLSFELSVGKERLIVNCGAWRGADARWGQVLRATAAHSTLTVDDTNSTVVLDHGALGAGPGRVDASRDEKDGAVWLEASHDGYADPYGLKHVRRLYVSGDGNDLRGEDRLQRLSDKASGRAYAVRFHLHPDVHASLVQDGSACLLKLPGGQGWQLRVAGGTLDLNESIYIGRAGERRRAEQVVITGAIDPNETIVRWALRKIPKN